MHPIDHRSWGRAYALALFTIAYNVVEGIVSTWFGVSDDSLTLFGFGLDSFIEAISGLGIAHMVVRMRADGASSRDRFEQTALRVTGVAFHGLAAFLCVTVVVNLIGGHRPETTLAGVVIAVISIAVMLWLIRAKTRLGNELGSPAILADAQCTKVCVYMSLVLLGSSAAYELTGIGHLDDAGAAAIAWFSFTEGRECFRKARTGGLCACDPPA